MKRRRIWMLGFLVAWLPVGMTGVIPIQYLDAPKATSQGWEGLGKKKVSRRDFIIKGTLTGLISLSLPQGISAEDPSGKAPAQEPATALPPTSNKAKVLLTAEEADRLITLFQRVVNHYYQAIRIETQKSQTYESLKNQVKAANENLLKALNKGLEPIGLKGRFNFPGDFQFLSEYFAAKGYWFEASRSEQVVQGRPLKEIWSFALGKILDYERDVELYFGRSFIGREEPVVYEEVFLDKLSIQPYHYQERDFVKQDASDTTRWTKQAYAASWIKSRDQIIIHDRSLLRAAGKALWEDLRNAPSLSTLEQEMLTLLRDQDYSAIEPRLSQALRLLEWGEKETLEDDPEKFADGYVALMERLALWRGVAQILDDKAGMRIPETGDEERDLALQWRMSLIRQILVQLMKGELQQEFLAQAMDWVRLEPEGALFYEAFHDLLIKGVVSDIFFNQKERYPNLNLQLAQGEKNQPKIIYTVLVALLKLKRLEIQRVAELILPMTASLKKETPQTQPGLPKGQMPIRPSEGGSLGTLAILQAI